LKVNSHGLSIATGDDEDGLGDKYRVADNECITPNTVTNRNARHHASNITTIKEDTDMYSYLK